MACDFIMLCRSWVMGCRSLDMVWNFRQRTHLRGRHATESEIFSYSHRAHGWRSCRWAWYERPTAAYAAATAGSFLARDHCCPTAPRRSNPLSAACAQCKMMAPVSSPRRLQSEHLATLISIPCPYPGIRGTKKRKRENGLQAVLSLPQKEYTGKGHSLENEETTNKT